MRRRCVLVLTVVCALAACGDSSPGTADAPPATADARRVDAPPPPVDAAAACGGVLPDPEADDWIGFYVFLDTYALAEPPLPIMRSGFEHDCWSEIERGQWTSSWFVTAVDHTVFIAVDGVETYTAPAPYAERDLKLWAIDDADPTTVVAFDDDSRLVPAGWKLHSANLTGAPIDVYRLVDPNTPDETAVLLEANVAHATRFVNDVPMDPAGGAWIRVVQAGAELARFQVAFWQCGADPYRSGIHVFDAIIESGRSEAAIAWSSNAEGTYCVEPTATRSRRDRLRVAGPTRARATR